MAATDAASEDHAAPDTEPQPPPAVRATIASAVVLAPSTYPLAIALAIALAGADTTASYRTLLAVVVPAMVPWIARSATSPRRVVIAFAAVAVFCWLQAAQWLLVLLIALAFSLGGGDGDVVEPEQGPDAMAVVFFGALALSVLLQLLAPFVAAWSLRSGHRWFGRLMAVLAGLCAFGGTIPLAVHVLR